MNYVRSALQAARLKLSTGLLSGFMALSLTACGSLSPRLPWSEPDPVDYSLVAENLVDAVGQYPRLNPLMATVQVSQPDNAFEREVQKEMRSRGYKLVGIDTNENGVVLDARIEESDDGSADAEPLYVLSVGEMSAERRFQQVDGQTQPSSQLIIRGAYERTVVLNDEQLFPSTDGLYKTVLFQAPAEPATLQERLASPQIAAATATDSTSPGTGEAAVKQNVYDIQQSNYSALFSDYEEVDSSILVFPNDSLQLGDTNKQIIEQYVAEMDPSTDILSVIGCSHGDTDISNGNSLLALGRANRVKEAFLFSGVDHELVLEEGCWAPVFYESMPTRGVLLTLKRRKAS